MSLLRGLRNSNDLRILRNLNAVMGTQGLFLGCLFQDFLCLCLSFWGACRKPLRLLLLQLLANKLALLLACRLET